MNQNLTSIRRDCHGSQTTQGLLSIPTSGASPVSLSYSAYSGGTLYLYANANAAVTITFMARPQVPDAPFMPLLNSSGSAVTRTVDLSGNKALPIPDECFGCSEIGVYASAACVAYCTLKG